MEVALVAARAVAVKIQYHVAHVGGGVEGEREGDMVDGVGEPI